MESSAVAGVSSLGSIGGNISEQAPVFAEFAVNESRDVLSFYELEEQILDLYDHLNDLKLEIGLLEARDRLPPMDEFSLNGDPVVELKAAEKDCLEARAAYILRNSIVNNVIITDPILKAVHSGRNATTAERSLHPLIDRRDILSIAHTNLSTALSSISKASTLVEAENIRAFTQNRARVAILIDLANKTKMQRTNALHGSRLNNQIEKVQNDTKVARIRWRIMKSVVAAVIVGSGIDWAGNDELRDLVLDDEDDED